MAACDEALWHSSARLDAASWPCPLRRVWVDCEAQQASSVRVLSWNVLADCKQRTEAERGYFSGGVLHAPRSLSPERSECLDWSSRRWALLHSILEHKADILLLQEVDHWEDFWKPQLSAAGYSGLWKGKDENCAGADGIAVVYRDDKWALEEADTGAAFAIVALLRDLHSKQRVLAASTHLASKKTPQAEARREKQSAELLERIASFREITGVCEQEAPVVLGGDFNAVSHSDAAIGEPLSYRQIVRSGLRSGYACATQSQEPHFTSWTLRGNRPADEVKRTVDYMFLSPSLQINAFLRLPTDAEVPLERAPTFSCPSDHFVLGLDLAFISGDSLKVQHCTSFDSCSTMTSLEPLLESSCSGFAPLPRGARPRRVRPWLRELLKDEGDVAFVAGDQSCGVASSRDLGRHSISST